jgi:hypothetical protein
MPLRFTEKLAMVILQAKTESDRKALTAICYIMDAQKNIKRRQALWNHFERTVSWSIKDEVATLHMIYNKEEDKAIVASPQRIKRAPIVERNTPQGEQLGAD